MTCGRCSLPGAPRKGWVCEEVEDLGEPDHTCDMCGNTEIRYVHHMRHAEFSGVLRVGCVCAGHMEEDYRAARDRERRLKNWEARRSRWLNRWRMSQNGNPYKKHQGTVVVIYRRPNGSYVYCAGGRWSREEYESQADAKLAAFGFLYPKRSILSN